MEPRHHHHSIHSCHLKHHRPDAGASGGFERYGGFPQLSRIFPPISSSSSTSSSTDSDIRVKRRFRFHRKWCACVFIAVLFVGLGAAAGIYFGYQFLSLAPAMEQLFRGSFTVTDGDVFTENLSRIDSSLFKERASLYKRIIDSLYSQTLVKNAFLGSEILAFDGSEGGPLTVLFNVHVDTHRIRVDAGDLFITLAESIRTAKGRLDDNITIDQDSLEIQERSMEFLYLPSTERNFHNVVMNEDNFIKPPSVTSTSTSTSVSTSSSSTTKKMLTSTPSYRLSEDSKMEPSNKIGRVAPKQPTIESKKCLPMSIDFCANATDIPLQSPIPDRLVSQLRNVVDSNCYPYAAHFICSSSVACQERNGGLNGSSFVPPCRDYCEEFLANCGQLLPMEFKEQLQCGPEWKGVGSCVTKPGCVNELYTSGQGHRICDGLMDCANFDDELFCSYCPPGNFHCGAGKQCILPQKKCDGVRDCSNGSDEKACLTLAPSSEAAGYVHQYFNEGYLFVHDQGKLGKLCVERNETTPESFWQPESQLLLDNIGSSACELLGFRKVAFVRVQPDAEMMQNHSRDPIASYVRIQEPGSSSEVTFTAGPCPTKKVLYVGCNHLECGQRPSHIRKSKGAVGHGDWPWSAALLRDNDHVCDATLVTSQWLLTSDQCFAGQSKAKWTVHFGRVRMSSTSPWQQERRVIGMVKSPLGDNLVLIKMASPIIFSDFARHVCLPDEPEGGPGVRYPSWEFHRGKCVRLGWSKQEEMVETSMHQLGTETCPPSPNFWSHNSTKPALCFENDTPGKDCLRELKVFPGGPVFCQNEVTKEWALAGIAPGESRPKCGIEKYRVSPVAGSTEWILKTIEALSN